MSTASHSVAAASLGEDGDDGLGLRVQYQAVGISSSKALLTNVAAPGTVAVDESRQITLTPVNVEVDAGPVPAVVTGA